MNEDRPRRRWIAHVDMDAFYASVELLRYPELKGQPVVIGGGRRHQPQVLPDGTRRFATVADARSRGVATTATYEARALGLHSGIPLARAAALAPHAVLLPVDFEEYRRLSRAFKQALTEVAPVMEDRGIDEIYLDLTEVAGAHEVVGHDPYGGVRALGQTLRNTVFRATGLTCSIGITPNKLLAKLASELDKPNGLTVLTEQDIPDRVWPLPVQKLNGIGPKATGQLHDLGINTLGQLAATAPEVLQLHFGRSMGQWLHRAAQGWDDRPVVTHREPVSMSRETTFERDLHPVRDRAELSEHFTQLCRRLAEDLQRKAYSGRTVGIKLRFNDFRTVTRDLTLEAPTAEAERIRQAAGQCLKRVALTASLRLLGVRMSGLVKNP